MDARTPKLTSTTKDISQRKLASSVLVSKISKLILGTTVLAGICFPFLVPRELLLFYTVGPVLFSLFYVGAWFLAETGRPVEGAWVFIVSTWLGQVGVVLGTGALTAQALVSCVNLILATGFMLGKRAFLWVSTVCVFSMLGFVLAGNLGILPVPSTQVGVEAGFAALTCVLLATAGLTYIGIDSLTAAVGVADINARQAREALGEVEAARQAEALRINRVERMGIMARNLVGLVEPEKLAQEVAIGLKDVLDAWIVMVLGRGGRVHAAAGMGERELPVEIAIEGFERLVPQGGFTVLDEVTVVEFSEALQIQQPKEAIVARGNQTSVTLLVLNREGPTSSDEVEWPVQVAANLLDAAMVRVESERQMVQAQKMEALNRLSAGIAHDFNNLLTTILGGAELLEHKAGINDPIQGHLRRIRDAGERAASLTSKLMTFTRGAPKTRELVELTTLTADLMPILRRTLEESIQIEHAIDEESIWVDADPIDIERIILNLVANARDAVGEIGRIDIGIEKRAAVVNGQQGDHVVLWVQDNGEGMDIDTRTRIFEPFFTTRKGKGATGLGLSIVYGVVQALRGHVLVDSGKGRGTCVEVHLPTISEPGERSIERKLPNLDPKGTRILVVEDDPDVRDTVCEMLRLGGFVTDSVGSGEEALNALANSAPYGLVLSDVIMPSMSGFDLAQIMAERMDETPIALISGYARGDDSTVEDQQVIPRITKPFSMSELMVFVQTNMA